MIEENQIGVGMMIALSLSGLLTDRRMQRNLFSVFLELHFAFFA